MRVSWYVCKSQRTMYSCELLPLYRSWDQAHAIKFGSKHLYMLSPFSRLIEYSFIVRRGVKFHPSTVKVNGKRKGGRYLLVSHPASGLWSGPLCCRQGEQEGGWMWKDLSYVS